jgi:hypothetical protein
MARVFFRGFICVIIYGPAFGGGPRGLGMGSKTHLSFRCFIYIHGSTRQIPTSRVGFKPSQ